MAHGVYSIFLQSEPLPRPRRLNREKKAKISVKMAVLRRILDRGAAKGTRAKPGKLERTIPRAQRVIALPKLARRATNRLKPLIGDRENNCELPKVMRRKSILGARHDVAKSWRCQERS